MKNFKAFCFIGVIIFSGFTNYKIFVPKQFSPDGDGVNDQFFIRGVGIIKYELSIKDYHGIEVFKSYQQWKGWDGKYKGIDVAEGTYFFHLKCKSNLHGLIERKGQLQLTRY